MKNVKIKLLLLLFLTVPLINFSQGVKTSKDFKLDISKPYAVVDGYKKWYFTHGDNILTIKFRGDFTFQLFNAKTMAQESVSVLAKKGGGLPDGFTHEEFIQNGDKITQFYSVWDKKNKIEQIFYKTLGFNTPTKESSPGKLLLKVDGKLKNTGGQNKVDVYQSFDKSKTLMVYELKKENTKDSENFQTFGLIAYDASMNELWKKEVKMPYSEAEITNMGYTLDNKGNAYLLLRKKKKDAKTPLELMKINGDASIKKINIKANDKHFPKGIKLQEGKDNKIYVAGFYGGFVASQGIYVSVLNQNGEIENEKFHEIPLEIINQNKSDKAQEKAEEREKNGDDVGIDHLALDEIRINQDGSLVLIGEVFFVITIPGASSATNRFNYREMLVTKVDQAGNLKWMKKLVKYQFRMASYKGDYGTGIVQARLAATKEPSLDMSYKYIPGQKDHYFLYIDNLKNMNLPLNKYPERHTSRAGGFLTAYKVNDDSGEVTKLSLFDLRNLKGIPVFQFDTDRIFQKSENEMFLEVYKKDKQDLMLKITINNE